jgi:hypothetical protein
MLWNPSVRNSVARRSPSAARLVAFVRISAPAIAVVLFGVMALKGDPAPTPNTLYDPHPDQLWNRLNATLFDRTAQDGKHYGLDELDILYWHRTHHLLTGPSHRDALAVLDEFNRTHGEQSIHDPLPRALLQRDLWQLFDWSAAPGHDGQGSRELQARLAVAIRRLALTTNEIAALPDNYARAEAGRLPDLPPGLFQTNGDWVGVRDESDSLTTPTHVAQFDGHSVFHVLVRLPGGRPAALAYLDQLRRFEPQWVYQTNRDFVATTKSPRQILALNPDLPQFPANTEWALVRRMCVIDTEGHIQPTPVTETIQLRRYREIKRIFQVTQSAQQFSEFKLDRLQKGALRAIGQNEKGFPFVHFMGMGIDPFEDSFGDPTNAPPRDSARYRGEDLKTCFTCHNDRGIFSVNSYTRFLTSSARGPADLTPLDLERDTRGAIYWKQTQYNWGLLQGIWNH